MCKAKSELSHRKSISSQGSKPICESDSIMLQHVISPYFKCSKENAGTIMQFSSRAVSRRQRRDHKLNSVSSFCELSITATPASNNYRVSLLKCIFLRFENWRPRFAQEMEKRAQFDGMRLERAFAPLKSKNGWKIFEYGSIYCPVGKIRSSQKFAKIEPKIGKKVAYFWSSSWFQNPCVEVICFTYYVKYTVSIRAVYIAALEEDEASLGIQSRCFGGHHCREFFSTVYETMYKT